MLVVVAFILLMTVLVVMVVMVAGLVVVIEVANTHSKSFNLRHPHLALLFMN